MFTFAGGTKKRFPLAAQRLQIKIISYENDPDLHLKLDFSEKWYPFYRISL
jgi:hypothetical protein